VLLAGAVIIAAAVAWTQPTAAPVADEATYFRIFRGLKPRMIIEVAEADVNSYLREHPEDIALPEDFADPQVAFTEGLVHVSARTKVLFVTSRVSVSLAPEITQGRLRLSVRRIKASGIPLPHWFHKGISSNLTAMINETLDRNGLQVRAVQIERGLIRVWAQVGPTPTTP